VAGQIATAYYFVHFLIIIPLFGIIDNVLSMVAISSHDVSDKEVKIKEVEVKKPEMTEEEKIKAREEDELYEFLYSVQNHTFNHIR